MRRWKTKDNDDGVVTIVKTNRYYSFDELEQTIIAKMALLLLFPVVLMAFGVFFYMSLKKSHYPKANCRYQNGLCQ